MNLFSIFDPYVATGIPLNWVGLLAICHILPYTPWLGHSRLCSLQSNVNSKVNDEFEAVMPSSAPGNTLMCLSLILFVIWTNLTGLIPYVFTSSSHLVFCAGLALPMWIGHMLMASIKSSPSVLSHLVPLGSPMALSPFMVVIELVSSLIRPLTLSVRLTANMVAGHLLLTLISSVCPSNPGYVAGLMLTPLILLMVLEAAVALIQGYVFSVLNILYLKEVDSAPMSA